MELSLFARIFTEQHYAVLQYKRVVSTKRKETLLLAPFSLTNISVHSVGPTWVNGTFLELCWFFFE
jgi:hypothetical protein